MARMPRRWTRRCQPGHGSAASAHLRRLPHSSAHLESSAASEPPGHPPAVPAPTVQHVEDTSLCENRRFALECLLSRPTRPHQVPGTAKQVRGRDLGFCSPDPKAVYWSPPAGGTAPEPASAAAYPHGYRGGQESPGLAPLRRRDRRNARREPRSRSESEGAAA